MIVGAILFYSAFGFVIVANAMGKSYFDVYGFYAMIAGIAIILLYLIADFRSNR